MDSWVANVPPKKEVSVSVNFARNLLFDAWRELNTLATQAQDVLYHDDNSDNRQRFSDLSELASMVQMALTSYRLGRQLAIEDREMEEQRSHEHLLDVVAEQCSHIAARKKADEEYDAYQASKL
jgi:hypothetical protein